MAKPFDNYFLYSNKQSIIQNISPILGTINYVSGVSINQNSYIKATFVYESYHESTKEELINNKLIKDCYNSTYNTYRFRIFDDNVTHEPEIIQDFINLRIYIDDILAFYIDGIEVESILYRIASLGHYSLMFQFTVNNPNNITEFQNCIIYDIDENEPIYYTYLDWVSPIGKGSDVSLLSSGNYTGDPTRCIKATSTTSWECKDYAKKDVYGGDLHGVMNTITTKNYVNGDLVRYCDISLGSANFLRNSDIII